MRVIYKKTETIFYNEVTTNKGNANIGNLQVRKDNAPTDISLKTSKRIREIIDIWTSVANVNVCTLEYKQWTESSNVNIKRDIKNFCLKLHRHGANEFLWRLEFNADGKAHFHVLYQSEQPIDVQKLWKHGLVYFTSFNERSLSSINKLSSYISKRKDEPNGSSKYHKIKHGMSDNLRNYKYPKGYAQDLPTDARKIGDYAYSSKETIGFENYIETWHDN
jgi:hypothetical protein